MKIALAGNPNSGKSSLFNQLTGMNQKVGNFPGVTVDKKSGFFKDAKGETVQVIDLPGTYSLYPKSEEEEVVREVLTNKEHPEHPDLVIAIVDATNIKRNLLLFSQIHDLGIPIILALNMMDLVRKRKRSIDNILLNSRFNVPVIEINARTGIGIQEIKNLVTLPLAAPDRIYFENTGSSGNPDHDQRVETLERYKFLDEKLKGIVHDPEKINTTLTRKLDPYFTHRIWGYGILLALLFIVFQAIFSWAEWPMDLIDGSFQQFSSWLADILPPGIVANLLTEGIIPGIGGIVIFIPQIAILFAFIGILEETGYMSRVVFLMDKIMAIFGLNGRSVVPLISGVACAVPAIMATRTISSKRDRLITILVTPFMSCSARLPVYTILIALVIPDELIFGVINLKGLVLFSLYILGFLAALIASLIIKQFVKTGEKSYLVMEMPSFKMPRWTNLSLSILEKTRTFVTEAGKIILSISIVLWFAASYGPGTAITESQKAVNQLAAENQWSEEMTQVKLDAAKLQSSYAGHFGKFIEPAIAPLGYDWKIGIALISSFAAREVFVGTIATIYSVGETSDELSIKEKLAKEVHPDTGEPRFNLAVGISLMLFYAFAMQCMSTIAVVYRETKGWKWPMIQLAFMTTLAYVSALIAYQVLR